MIPSWVSRKVSSSHEQPAVFRPGLPKNRSADCFHAAFFADPLFQGLPGLQMPVYVSGTVIFLPSSGLRQVRL